MGEAGPTIPSLAGEPCRTSREIRAQGRSHEVSGLPRQRLSGVERTFDAVIKLAPDRIAYYAYAHVPWRKGVAQRGFDELEIPRGAEKRRLYEQGRTGLEQSGYLQFGLDHFALPGDPLHGAATGVTLQRNFMGYTALKTRLTLGLGMSAIGDTGNAFAQNEKSVKAWALKVSAGSLPVMRGHLLNREDLLIRRHVDELMCRLETRWRARAIPADLQSEIKARLAGLEADGLVSVSDTGVRVTDAGRPFLRDVCMAFDARLWRALPQTQVFSQAI